MYVSSHIYNMYEASPPSRPYCVSTIFHSSLFPKRKCNSHSSFYILHLEAMFYYIIDACQNKGNNHKKPN